MNFKSTHPVTEEILKEFPPIETGELLMVLTKMQEAYEVWSKTAFQERSEKFKKLSENLKLQKKELAELMTLEMGKPVCQALAEIDKCAWVCEYYAENAEAFLADEIIQTEATKSFVCHRPTGIILSIMPWNFPFWQVFRCAAPALMAGNTLLLKHAPNVPQCALTIEGLFHGAGFPLNCFRSIFTSNENTSLALVHPSITGITLTGSSEAGKQIATQAGSQLKPVVMELGGNDAFIVLEDADIEKAALAAVTSRFLNNGQNCIAAKRMIAVESIYEIFRDAVLQQLKNYSMTEPMNPESRLGPMARKDLRDKVADQVQRSIDAGAKCLLGGKIPEKTGWWYPATILENISPDSPAATEEIFGPVACLFKVKDEEEAIRLANQSLYGLGAVIFSQNIERAEKIAREEIESGACFVNDFVKSDPRLPFGGIKDSGLGRELGKEGIRAFCNIKTIVIQ